MGQKKKLSKRAQENIAKVEAQPKVPRGLHTLDQLQTQYPSWRTKKADLDGPFGWRDVPTELLLREIVPKLHEFEEMTWGEFSDGHHHDVSADKLSAEAKRRLRKIRNDSVDSLFSIRLSGTERVWAERSLTRLDILWWDPNHLVCPSERDPVDRKKAAKRRRR